MHVLNTVSKILKTTELHNAAKNAYEVCVPVRACVCVDEGRREGADADDAQCKRKKKEP